MKKRSVVMAAMIVVLIFSAIVFSALSVPAQNTYNLSELANCRKLFSLSGSSAAYFYGYSNTTLYSARVLPDYRLRSASVDGVICSVCHDDSNAYALYEYKRKYYVLKLNCADGNCITYPISAADNVIYSSFAATSDGVYLIINSGAYSTAVRFDYSGNKRATYKLPDGVSRLFVNAGSAYAVAYSGGIFRLTGSGQTVNCATLDAYTEFSDAGWGYVYTKDKTLISLNDGSRSARSQKLCVKTKSKLFDSDSGRLLAAVGNRCVYLDGQNHVMPLTETQAPTSAASKTTDTQNGQNKTAATVGTLNLYDDSTVIADCGITVRRFKEKYPQLTQVFDRSGKAVTSGKLRTGYSAAAGSKKYVVIIQGDVNGSGTVNNADIRQMMEYLCGNITLSDAGLKAADIDMNKARDTRDLVRMTWL